jgi:copper chaperone CopZ
MIQNDKAEPRSAWEVKRKIRIPVALASAADAKTLEQALRDIDGILQVSANGAKGTVFVRYLVTKTDYQALECALEAAGFPPAAGRWARFRSGWYQSLDLTGRENAGARPSACCNKPPTR